MNIARGNRALNCKGSISMYLYISNQLNVHIKNYSSSFIFFMETLGKRIVGDHSGCIDEEQISAVKQFVDSIELTDKFLKSVAMVFEFQDSKVSLKIFTINF